MANVLWVTLIFGFAFRGRPRGKQPVGSEDKSFNNFNHEILYFNHEEAPTTASGARFRIRDVLAVVGSEVRPFVCSSAFKHPTPGRFGSL